MRETAHLSWEGELAFSGASGSEGPIAWQGDEGSAGLRPSEAVLASLGACTAMDVISILHKKRQTVERYEVELEAELADAHPKIFRRITVTHVVAGPGLSVEAVRRSIELSATRYCIVNATLSSGLVEIHHRYRVSDGVDGSGAQEAEVVVTGPHGAGVALPDDAAGAERATA
ncbi:MAG TPA: OsmC family protein [Candidatus Limnocylindrales bacterium]|nr:OsmC family protein [Candidatus Limnocylindrales bacterium]